MKGNQNKNPRYKVEQVPNCWLVIDSTDGSVVQRTDTRRKARAKAMELNAEHIQRIEIEWRD